MDTLKKHITKQLYYISIEKQPLPQIKSFWGVEYDTLALIASFAVPLISFFLGFLLTVLRDKFRDQKEIKIVSKLFLLWLEKTIKNAKLLSDELKNKMAELEQLNDFQFSKPALINLHLALLPDDQKLLYKAFVQSKIGSIEDNSKDYYTIINDLEFLKTFQEMLLQNSQIIINEFESLFDNWNNDVLILHKIKHNIVGRRSQKKDKKVEEVNDMFNAWYALEETKLSDTNKFLNDLEPILQNYYQSDPTDDEIAELIAITQKIKVTYQRFVFKKKDVIKLFDTFYNQLNDTVIELEKLSVKMANKKDKFSLL